MSYVEAAPPPGQILQTGTFSSPPAALYPVANPDSQGIDARPPAGVWIQAPQQRTAHIGKVLPAGDQPFLNFSVCGGVKRFSEIGVLIVEIEGNINLNLL